MFNMHRWILAAGAALGLVIGVGGVAVAAPANSTDTTSSTARLSNGQAVDSAAAAQKVADYWTADRMSKATPAPEPAAGSTTTAQVGKATGPAGSTAPAKSTTSEFTPLINESAVAGKVFFSTFDGRNWVCSASALNSPSKQLVITAGHCVYGDLQGQVPGETWHSNWTFVPRYRSGVRPFGTFAAKQFRTFNAWINSSDLSRDVGLVTTWPLNGNKLVNVVGGHGLNWNFSTSVFVTILAYPGNFNGGEIQQWCQGTTSDGGGGTIKIGCNFGGGASGGGWLMSFNDSTGIGQVNGVMSTLDGSGFNRSPYFDTAVKTMFDAQGSVT